MQPLNKYLKKIIYLAVYLFAIIFAFFAYLNNQYISIIIIEAIIIVFTLLVWVNFFRKSDIDQAKNDFVSLASHQLCTPLTAINWYTEMLLDGDAGKLNKEQEKYVKQVYHSNKRMILLVNALLNVSRIDLGTFSIEPEMIDITKISDEVLIDLPPLIKNKKVNIEKKYGSNTEKFLADPNLIRIIFQNILSNSIKYTAEGGKIELAIKKSGDKLVITIHDNGCGIPREQQDKIFTKLFRADNVRRMETDGTGMGLFIVKSIVEQAGGRIWFESDSAKGTTFYISFPGTGMTKKLGSKRLS
jgi:signal transduction histidine kinase